MSENVPGGFRSITDPYWTAADFLRLAERGTPPIRYWALQRLDDLDLEIPAEVLRRCLREADEILVGGAAVLIGERGISALAELTAFVRTTMRSGFPVPSRWPT
jgi:hypothetical protein